MAVGILLSMALGATWALIGVVLTKVAKSNTSAITFYMSGCWLAAGFSWLFLADWPVLAVEIPARTAELSVWLGLSGILNSLGQLLLVNAMNSGHKGVSWAIVQTGMLIPLIASFIFWSERISLAGACGIALLLLAIILMSRGRRDSEAQPACGISAKWLFFVFGALFLIGSSQAFQTVSSHWANWQDEGNLRVCFLATSGAIANTFWVALQRETITRKAIGYGAVWAVLAIFSYIILFHAIDILAREGMSGFVFPFSQATCMVGFALYSLLLLKERFSRSACYGLCCGVTGIIMMAFR